MLAKPHPGSPLNPGATQPKSQPDQTDIEVLKAIRESAYARWEKRRDYEWKLSFGLWTAMAAFIAIVVGNTFKIQISDAVKYNTGACAGLITLAHLLYLIGIIRNTIADLKIQYWAEDRIAEHVKPFEDNHNVANDLRAFPGAHKRPRGFWVKYYGFAQVGITLILAIASYLAISADRMPPA